MTQRKKSFAATPAGILIGLLMLFLQGAPATAEDARVLKLGVRDDCAPFSYHDPSAKTYRGFSVDLCLEIARNASAYMNYQGFVFEPVTARDRFKKLNSPLPDEKIDILCEATTVTQQRMRRFSPTMYTFISGASLMYSSDIPRAQELKVGVLKGTTTEHQIREILEKQTDLDLGRFDGFKREDLQSHGDVLPAFRKGTINLYIADREILLALIREGSEEKQRLIVSRNYYSIEPYALFLRVDDSELRYIANLTLSEIYKSDIQRIFASNFPGKRMNDSLLQLYRLQQLLRGVDPLAGN